MAALMLDRGTEQVDMIVDRFEGDLAVVELEGKTFALPRALLPKEAKEGDVLKISIEVDQDATADRRRKVKSLENRLFRE